MCWRSNRKRRVESPQKYIVVTDNTKVNDTLLKKNKRLEEKLEFVTEWIEACVCIVIPMVDGDKKYENEKDILIELKSD